MPPLTTETAAPLFGNGDPPRWVTGSICIVDRVLPDGIQAVIYPPDASDDWVNRLRQYLDEGRSVAVAGQHAQAVVDRYLNG